MSIIVCENTGLIKLVEIDRLVPGNLYKVFALYEHTDNLETFNTGRIHLVSLWDTNNDVSAAIPVLSAVQPKEKSFSKHGSGIVIKNPSEPEATWEFYSIHPEEDVVMFLEYDPMGFKLLWKTKVGVLMAGDDFCIDCFVDV